MATANLFSDMPQVNAEVLDKRLRIDPDLAGKRIAILGRLDCDGYGYLHSVAVTPSLVTPGSKLKHLELAQVTDLGQFFRRYAVSTNVGEADELTPAVSECMQQGASNIAVMRLDMAVIKSSTDNVLRAVRQTTGKPPTEWLKAMGMTIAADGTVSNTNATLDPSTHWVPSIAYRTWVNSLYSLSTALDTTTAQAHQDPTMADMRYFALGEAYNALTGEDVQIIVLAGSPGYIHPERAVESLGVYPLRPETTISTPSSVIDQSLPTINNPYLNNVILNTDSSSEDYRKFKSFDAIGFDAITSAIALNAANNLATGDTIVVNCGTQWAKAVVVASSPTAASGEFIVGASATATATNLAAALTANNASCVTAVGSGANINLTSLVAGEAGRIGIVVVKDANSQFTITPSKSGALLDIDDETAISQGTASTLTIDVTDTNIDNGDTVTVTVSGVTQIFTAAASPSGNTQFAHGTSDDDSAENLLQAILGTSALMAVIASVSRSSNTITIIPAQVGDTATAGHALATSDATAFAVDDTDPDGSDGDQFILTSNSRSITVEAGPLNLQAALEFRADALSASNTASNIATIINGDYNSANDANFRAFAVQDNSLWHVAICSELADDASTDYDITFTETNIGSGMDLNDGNAGLAYASLATLAGSDTNSARRSFAHQLATYCQWQSHFESSCKGFIGCEPVDTDLDGVVTGNRLKEYIGRETVQINQYMDDANNVAYTSNGTGILGFVDMVEYDGIHRLHANPALPHRYKFFAHAIGEYQVERDNQQNTILFDSDYGDALHVDTDKGEYIDMGARLRVTVGDVFVFNPVSQRYNETRGAYVTNAAASMAGLDAIRPEGRSLTHLTLRDVVPMRRFSNTQVNSLLKSRFIPVQVVANQNIGEIQADNTGAHKIDDYNRSDFTYGLNLDTLDACIEDARAICRPLIGRGMSPQLVAHLTEEIEDALNARKEIGHIQDFNFRFESTPVMQVLGQARIHMEIIPAFEIRTIKIRAGLQMPNNALVGTASSV